MKPIVHDYPYVCPTCTWSGHYLSAIDREFLRLQCVHCGTAVVFPRVKSHA